MIGNDNAFGSFRDPNGFMFLRKTEIYRQINEMYRDNYIHLTESGLYKLLVDKKLLVSHSEVNIKYAKTKDAFKVIKPDVIPFISYPYEWSFSQIKEAALLTLKIQIEALRYGMVLKDCSAYNIQFIGSKPIFIDLLSFEKYKKGEPWNAYRQFCQHFLGPLVLMSYKDLRLNQLLRVYIDGLPLDLVSLLLPLWTYLKFGTFTHIHMHAKYQVRFEGKRVRDSVHGKFAASSMYGLIDNLQSLIDKLSLRIKKTQWAQYYKDRPSYDLKSIKHKKQVVNEFLDRITGKSNPSMAWDMGANQGVFSRICSDRGIYTVSFDNDTFCVEQSFRDYVRERKNNILPLFVDLVNPSPSIGWDNEERMSLLERGPADVVLALALIHHLAISNNVALGKIARFFCKISTWLIIEFIPKTDPMMKKLLSNKEDIFPDYKNGKFEEIFSEWFTIHSKVKIENSERVLYLMRRN